MGTREELLARDEAWSAAASSGAPVEEVLDYWSEDAWVVPPGMDPVVGRDALRDYVQGSMAIPGFRISWEAQDIEVSADGTMAYTKSTNLVEMTGEDGQPQAFPGRAVTVWRCEDGVWRCCADIWNGA